MYRLVSISILPLNISHTIIDNVSPYSSGLPGASLTSTSVDPHTASTPAMFDEEELMFEAIQNPPKARKEKDIGKVRAYVRVITSLGGSLNLELYCEKVSIPDLLIPWLTVQPGT
jgi:peptidyl-prolyl cis-trans isomerase-like 2